MRRRPFSSVMARRPVLILSSSARQGRDLRATTLAWSKDETQIRLKRQRVLHSFFLLLVPRGQKKKIEKNPLSRLSLVLLLENAKKKLANFDAERTAFRPDLRKAEKRRDTSRVTGRAEGVGREAAVELDPRRRRHVEPAGEIGGRLGEHADVVGEEEARDPAGDAGDVDSGELGCV